MANNIVALNLNGNEYNFRPLYIVDGYGSLNGNEAVSLGYFSAVNGASLLVYLSEKDSNMDGLIVQFEAANDSMVAFANYHGRELHWGDLGVGQVYEFVFFEGTFDLTADIPKTSIKYRDSKNQLRSLVVGEDPDIDLSSGVYYATTSATASRVANTLTLTDVNGNVCNYNGSESFDLSAGVNYAEHAATADSADYAEGAGYAERAGELKKRGTIPGAHIASEYCRIGWIDTSSASGVRNCIILFTGHGYNDLQYAPWSGILYFEWHNDAANNILASAKWMSLTRADLSNSILLTFDRSGILHIYFAYINTYASADVTIINGSNINFDFRTTTRLIGTTIATSTFDGGGGGAESFRYQLVTDSGSNVWHSLVNLNSDQFVFRPGPNIDIYPTHTVDSTQTTGVLIKLSDEFTQAFTQLQQYVELLQYTVNNQRQQIADLKSVLTEITTGKTWDDNVWGSTAGQGATSSIVTDEHGFVDIHPL